jgi:hypothetical protein
MGTQLVEARAETDERARGARESRAIALFGTWMIIGLFLDGWAHGAQKPETFFSPWHGILYSGFVAAVLWFVWDSRHQPREARGLNDRLAVAGLALFIVGAVGDGAWHQIFGIEVNLEALLSPTHLALMIGGALMVTAPIRHAVKWLPERPTMREFFSPLASLTLVTSLVLFFLMDISASAPVALRIGEAGQRIGVASVIIRTAVVMGAALLLLQRWTPPAGSLTVLFTVPAVALAGLKGFHAIQLAIPFFIGGVVADAIVARSGLSARGKQAFCILVPLVTWLGYFALHAIAWRVLWPAEIWTGSILFAVLTSVVLGVLSFGRPVRPRQARR